MHCEVCDRWKLERGPELSHRMAIVRITRIFHIHSAFWSDYGCCPGARRRRRRRRRVRRFVWGRRRLRRLRHIRLAQRVRRKCCGWGWRLGDEKHGIGSIFMQYDLQFFHFCCMHYIVNFVAQITLYQRKTLRSDSSKQQEATLG